MRPHSPIAVVGFCWALALPSLGQTLVKDKSGLVNVKRGVIVEKVPRNSQGENAGIREGDILLSWRQGHSHGDIGAPFDLPRIETERASLGVVRIGGIRGNVKRNWFFHANGWDLWVRPNISGELLSIYEEGHRLAKAGNIKAAAERWQIAAQTARKSNVAWLPSWFLLRAAQWLIWAGQSETAFGFYEEAVEQAAGCGPVVKADLLWQWASRLEYAGDISAAEHQYKEVLSEWTKLGSETVAVAASLVDLGRVAREKGDLKEAEEYFNQILSMSRNLPHGNVQLAVSMMNLGLIFEGRGELAKAEAYYRRVLSIETKPFPRAARFAWALHNLAALEYQRGNPAASEKLYWKAVHAASLFSPGTSDEAHMVEALAECVAERGRLPEAEKLQRRALAIILKKESPTSLAMASSLAGLGRTARLRRNFDAADKYYTEALSIARKLAPSSLELANFLIGAGILYQEQHDFAKAESCYRQALPIMEKLAPHHGNHTDTLFALARIMHQRGQVEEAARLYEKTVSEVEHQTTRLGGIEDDDSRFRASYEETYKDYASLLLETQQPERAFEVIEMSRARSLLETLSKGRVDLQRGVDPGLLMRAHDLQQKVAAKSDYQIRLLQRKDRDEEAAALSREIENLWAEYQGVQAEIRASSPNYAALAQPRKWSLAEIQAVLDDDTVLLEYCLANNRSYVWVITEDSIAAFELPKRAEIESAVRTVYWLFSQRSIADAKYQRSAEKLSRMILGPVAANLGRKRLLIVSDGALQYLPFSALPVPDSNGASPTRALVFDHEIINLPSASVVAELRRLASTREIPPMTLAVLADPVFDSQDERVTRNSNRSKATIDASNTRSQRKKYWAPHPLTRSAMDLGLTQGDRFYLSRLLYTRREADSIMAMVPKGKGVEILDFQASRAAALSPNLAKYQIVHFATHGLLDNKHPELSGLVFSLVDRNGKPQDGFLQLEDIYNLKLPVDLVVLSGCETALGQDVSGEGLIGLTRGFMYAGASRVVASLWSVSDVATAEFMRLFYRAIQHEKLRPAAALQRAQIEMLRQKQWSSPYYWAAFEIHGEWN